MEAQKERIQEIINEHAEKRLAYAVKYLEEREQDILEARIDIQEAIANASEENESNLTPDIFPLLLLILNAFTNIDEPYDQYLNVVLPASKYYMCCMNCCNTSPENELAQYHEDFESFISDLLDEIETIIGISPMNPLLREHIHTKAKYVFENYKDYDVIVIDEQMQTELTNFIDCEKTSFRLLTAIILEICEPL